MPLHYSLKNHGIAQREYDDFLNPSLAIVDTITDLQAVDAEIAAAKESVADAESRYRASDAAVYEKIQQALANNATDTSEEPLRRAIDRVRLALRSGVYPVVQSAIEDCVACVRSHFSRLDEKALETWLGSVLDTEGSQLTQEVQKAKKAYTSACKRRQKLLQDSVAAVFKDGQPPVSFKGRNYDGYTPEEMVAIVADTFYSDWKERSTWFDCPVDIRGCGLFSLPEEAQARWFKAYQKLGFDKLEKRPRYGASMHPDYIPPKQLRYAI